METSTAPYVTRCVSAAMLFIGHFLLFYSKKSIDVVFHRDHLHEECRQVRACLCVGLSVCVMTRIITPNLHRPLRRDHTVEFRRVRRYKLSRHQSAEILKVLTIKQYKVNIHADRLSLCFTEYINIYILRVVMSPTRFYRTAVYSYRTGSCCRRSTTPFILTTRFVGVAIWAFIEAES